MKTSEVPLKTIVAGILAKMKRNDSVLQLSKDQLKALSDALLMRRDELVQDVSIDQLTLLLKHLCQNIIATNDLKTQSGSAGSRPFEGLEAANAIMMILTTPCIPREVCSEKVIHHVVQLARRLLEQNVYPSYDSNFFPSGTTEPSVSEKGKKLKKASSKIPADKPAQISCAKIVVLVERLVDYFEVEAIDQAQTLQEVIKLTAEPFFVEAVTEIREPSIKILNQVFVSYECSPFIWEYLVSTSMRLAPLKRECKWFPLEMGESTCVSMFSGLVMLLLQNTVSRTNDKGEVDSRTLDLGLERSQRLTDSFLDVFVPRMVEKWEDRESKHLLEMFTTDLTAALFHPLWPVAETVVNKLAGYLLFAQRYQMTSKMVDATSRNCYAEMFGCLTTRHYQLEHQLKPKATEMNELLQSVREEIDADMEAHGDTSVPTQILDRVLTTRALQNALLAKLASVAEPSASTSARTSTNFGANSTVRLYRVALWVQDLRRVADAIVADAKPSTSAKGGKAAKRRALQTSEATPDSNLTDESREILIAQVNSRWKTGARSLTAAEAALVSRYLAVSRTSFKTCNWYLDQLLAMIFDPAVMVRNRVARFIRQIAEIDTDVLALSKIQRAILTLLSDKSASVRETMVDMIGKIVPLKPELINIAFGAIIKMLQDASLCVKKRCVRLLREVALSNPTFTHLNTFSKHVLARVSEEGMQKTVVDTLEQIWFTVPSTQAQLESRIKAVVSVGSAHPVHFQSFLNAMLSERDIKTEATKMPPPESTLTVCRRIAHCLVTSLTSEAEGAAVDRWQLMAVLFYLAKAMPSLAVKHSTTLLGFLNSFSETDEAKDTLRFAVQVLELTLPSVDGIDPAVAAKAERAFVEALGPKVQDPSMVASCISCLAAIVKRITKNYSAVRKLFRKSLRALKDYKQAEIDMQSNTFDQDERSQESPARHIYIVGMMLQKFNIVTLGYSNLTLGKSIVKECLEILCAIANRPAENGLSVRALKAIGLILVRHPNQMMSAEVKILYQESLLACTLPEGNDNVTTVAACIQVLRNIDYHITEEEAISARIASKPKDEVDDDDDYDEECQNMARTLVSIHLREILATVFSPCADVRKATAMLLQNVVRFGVVATHQVISYLVVMCSDPCTLIARTSREVLCELHTSHPTILCKKLLEGVKMLHKFMAAVRPDGREGLVRGFTMSGDEPQSVMSSVYSLIRSDQTERRTFMESVLKQFDQHAKTPLRQLLFLADILAHLPYQIADEPMFLINRLEMICTLASSDLVDDWKEMVSTPTSDSSEADSPEAAAKTKLTAQAALDAAFIRDCIVRSHAHNLLVDLKNHLKPAYNITECKMAAYSASQSKPHERQATRRLRPPFNPASVLEAIERGQDSENRANVDDELAQDYFDLKFLMMDLHPMDPESLERFDRKVAVLNKRMQQEHKGPRLTVASGSGKKRERSLVEKGFGVQQKTEAPKKRKVLASKNSVAKEEDISTSTARDTSRSRKHTSKRLF